jgi:hypothetical protein
VQVERRLHRHNTTVQAAHRRGSLLAANRHVERLRKDRESESR